MKRLGKEVVTGVKRKIIVETKKTDADRGKEKYMGGLKKLLNIEQERLERILAKAQDELYDVPEGTLRISIDKGCVRFYHNNQEQGIMKYIPKADEKLIQRLAKKDYYEKIERSVKKRLGQISRLLKDYDENEIDKIYNAQHPIRRQIVTPIEPTWEQQLEAWNNRTYEGKIFQEGTIEIYTEKGERVRSKSEKILADYFYRNHIPYKYECPLHLKGYGVVYPDFTFLSYKTRREIYWEHEGRMDDPAYAKNAVKKLLSYSKNGIFPGENLILTFETEQTVLNTEVIECLTSRYLL